MSSISINKFVTAHDDMLGKTRTAISGASQTSLAQIRDTGFILEWFSGSQDDFMQITIQVPHSRKLGSALDSLHIHYVLTTAPLAAEEVWFDYAYAWVQPGAAVPALSGWTANTAKLIFTGTEGANYYGIFSIVSNIAAPVGEGYGGMILLKITRNAFGSPSDTYSGDVGILDIDAHTVKDRVGSTNEASD